jgi:hypothetical protein
MTPTTTMPNTNPTQTRPTLPTNRDLNLDWTRHLIEEYTADFAVPISFPAQYTIYAAEFEGLVVVDVPAPGVDPASFRSAVSSFLADALVRDARDGHPVYEVFGVRFWVRRLFGRARL